MKQIAVIGGGVAGLTAAYYLREIAEVTVYEANEYLGGHTQTHVIAMDGKTQAVDTGFIVFNDRTYPQFEALLDRLGCEGQKTEMSFSLKRPGFEYNGHNLNTLFAQRRNIINPVFWRMLVDIMRFNRLARRLDSESQETLGDFVKRHKFCRGFIENYLVPMAAAIWSSGDAQIYEFPIGMLAQFFHHHGLLDLKNRPQWYVVKGGSNQYVKALQKHLQNVRLQSPVQRIRRTAEGVQVTTEQHVELFDEVVIACHSPEALAMLEDPSPEEVSVLGAMRFCENNVTLHQDSSVMPQRNTAWASWNYHGPADGQQTALTYYMNRLQGFESRLPVLVTLNDFGGIAEDRVIKRLKYEHPVFDTAMLTAQKRHAEISGVRSTHYCGAYWRYGFHEDGVMSAQRVVDAVKAAC